MEVKNYKDLEIWQLFEKLIIKVYKLLATFPPEEKFGIVSQAKIRWFRSLEILLRVLEDIIKMIKISFTITQELQFSSLRIGSKKPQKENLLLKQN